MKVTDDLIEKFRAGDQEAFEALYKGHRKLVYRVLRRTKTRATDEALDELSQDVWMAAYKYRASYDPQWKFSTWLGTITWRLHHRWRNEWTAEVYLEDLVGTHQMKRAYRCDKPLPEEVATYREQMEQLVSLIKSGHFNRGTQRLLFGRIVEGKSVQITARRYGIKRATATAWFQKGKRKLAHLVSLKKEAQPA